MLTDWLLEEMHIIDKRSKTGISHYAIILMESFGSILYEINTLSEICPWFDMHK